MNYEWTNGEDKFGAYLYSFALSRAGDKIKAYSIDCAASGWEVVKFDGVAPVTVAGPFDTLDAAKAAYLLIGENA